MINSVLLFSLSSELYNHLVITPQSPVLEIGTNFTATCSIINTDEITAKDLYWNLSDITVSNKQYTKINSSSLSVTIPVIGEKHEWLFCFCKEVSNYVYLNRSKFRHGIILTKGCKFLCQTLKSLAVLKHLHLRFHHYFYNLCLLCKLYVS